jgi:hypothetical protein
MQENTKRIIREDDEVIRPTRKFLASPCPRWEQTARSKGFRRHIPHGERSRAQRIPYLQTGAAGGKNRHPGYESILGRNTAEETLKESQAMYDYAQKLASPFFILSIPKQRGISIPSKATN